MRPAALILGLTTATVTLVAVYYGGASHQAVGVVESSREEGDQPRQTASIDTESKHPGLHESTVIVPQRSKRGHQSPMDKAAVATAAYVDEATDRDMVRDEATRDVQKVYPLLIKDLDLTASEADALLAFLIEDLVANTKTPYSSGKGMDEHERSKRIAAIIGDSKREQFLALEGHRREFAEVQQLGSMLAQKEVPLTDTQRDGLLKILLNVREQVDTKRPEGVKPNSMASLEHVLNQMDEYERLVLELAPSVLSAKQVVHLFERYQTLSYNRAHALQVQQDARAAEPTGEDVPLWYPARD